MIGGTALMALTAVSATMLAAPSVAVAQDISSGTLTGSVASSGAPVAGASVEIRSNAQGFVRNTTTDANGAFRAALIPIGTYTVTIQADGYNPISQTASVGLGGQSSFTFEMAPASGDAVAVSDIVVTGARQSLDFNRTTTGLTVDLEELVKTLPVGRDITAVTLLAPSTVQGDSAFGNVPAIGGSSVAENAFYVNGLNITNFNNYIGGSTVPFDFYRSVEVKTGGYAAEFGRATGGIVNAVTKSGSNEFEFALRGNWAPDSLRSQSPDTFSQRNALDERDASNITVEAGGPIIRDRLFFFGLAQFQDQSQSDASITAGQQTRVEADDPFYGFKLDGYITSDHRLEFTYWDSSRESRNTYYGYDYQTDTVGSQILDANGDPVVNTALTGGESYVARYTGTFTDWLTLSAAYGRNEDRDTLVSSTGGYAYAVDARSGTSVRVSPAQPSSIIDTALETTREFYRGDADIYFSMLGDHHVRMGYEKEQLTLFHTAVAPGPNNTRYFYRRASATTAQLGPQLAVGQDYIEATTYRSGGTFTNDNIAYYIQDSWDVTDQLTLNLGVRLDQFTLNNADGVEVINFDKEIGPRLAFNFDPSNDGRSRIFGSYGRYYLPVAANTAFRQAGAELFFREYFQTNGAATPYDANGVPVARGTQITYATGAACPAGGVGTAGVPGCSVLGDGTAVNPISAISKNLESTAEDEWILGYERKVGDNWTFGANLIYRDLLRNAEDVAIDAAVRNYCNDEGIVGCDSIWTGFHQYVILNPGASSQITLSDVLPGETELRTVNFTAAELGYPEAERQYTALELTFKRDFDGVWGLQGSWTISESTGNTEGYVKSDVGQDDSGITQDFDQPGLTEGSNGLLPNHRGHVFKAFGSYQVTRDLMVGANVSISSPRAFGCLGLHPTDVFAAEYGAASNYCQGNLTPRGTQAESDWIKQIDVSLRYNVPLQIPGDLVLRADIFNLFNFDGTTDLYEFGDLEDGRPDPNYRAPIGYQAPRFVRLGFDWQF